MSFGGQTQRPEDARTNRHSGDDEVYEPLERYDREFRDKFSGKAKECFENLVKESGVIEEENAKLVAEVHRLENGKSNAEKVRGWWTAAIVAEFIGMAAGIIYAFQDTEDVRAMCIGIGIALVLLILCFPTFKKRKQASALVESLANQLEQATNRAYDNMAPLLSLFHWYILNDLVEQTVPLLHFDTYCPVSRIAQLEERFGLARDLFGSNESVMALQSGIIRGNPFVFVRSLAMKWGEKTYTGSLTISWTTTERDSEGHSRTVHHTQTLHASVTKPIPVYGDVTRLLYGNDAAPHLSFTRTPSKYSGKKGNLLADMGKKHELGKLKKYARILDDDSDFMMMSNEEFEVLFHAKDRDDEIEFRVLFTPLAQMQMVKLLNDTKTGYGDDFAFEKRRKMNFITPEHLSDTPIDGDPAHFRDYDLGRLRVTFQKIAEDYFRGVYFAFAPLLTIPLYQQTRSYEEIYKDVLGQPVSGWEHESFVNWFGEAHFAHENSITRNILKAECTARKDGAADVQVTAYGYRGVEHTEYISVHGGDGRWYNVPVKWVEYLPVQKTSDVKIAEPETGFRREARSISEPAGKSSKQTAARVCRRTLYFKK